MTDWKALRETMDAATEGPWERQGPERVVAPDSHETIGTFDITDDATFIAEARTALPEMYALLVEAREALSRHATGSHQYFHEGPMPTCQFDKCGEDLDLIARLPEDES